MAARSAQLQLAQACGWSRPRTAPTAGRRSDQACGGSSAGIADSTTSSARGRPLAEASSPPSTASYALVPAASPPADNADVDCAGISVAFGQGSAYDLFLTWELSVASIERLKNAPAVRSAISAGEADVAAGIRQQLQSWATADSSLRLLPGHFMVIQQAIGTPAGRGEAAAQALWDFGERMTSTGFVADALGRHGVHGASVAPAATSHA